MLAPTDQARAAAILGVFKGVNLGVYTADGGLVLAGGERSATDVWVYDFEVEALAAAVRDGDERDLRAELADLATYAGQEGGGAVTAEDLLSAVADAARSVRADPGQPRAYALAVAVELAGRGTFRTDLADADASAPVIVDPLTAFLVVADLVLPHVEAQEPPLAGLDGLTAAAVMDVDAPPPQAAGPCGVRPFMPGWVAGVAGGRFSGLAGVPNASFDRFLQSRLVGATVVAKLEGPRDWHHDHEESDGGIASDGTQRYIYSIRLRGPGAVVSCGLLAGTSLPPGGEIVGASVTWDHPDLDFHAVLIRQSTTGANGLAYIEAEPNVERWPSGIGPEQKALVPVSAEVNVLQALGGDLYARLAGVPAIQRRTVYTDVTWHRSYSVEVDIASVLKATRGASYDGLLGTTSATGTIPIVGFRNAAEPPPPPGFDYWSRGTLTTTATSAPTKGTCNTEWILEKPGASRNIDWQVLDLAIWPPEEAALRLDTGTVYEEPDQYDGLICAGGSSVRLGPSPGNVWENLIFLAYPNGIRLQGTGSGKWTVVGTADTWAVGGEILKWSSQETCQGRCSGVLDVVVRVQPHPGP